jgi:hypothetical protein
MVNYEQLLRQPKQQQPLQHIDGINNIKISMGEKPLVSRTKVKYLFLLILKYCIIFSIIDTVFLTAVAISAVDFY